MISLDEKKGILIMILTMAIALAAFIIMSIDYEDSRSITYFRAKPSPTESGTLTALTETSTFTTAMTTAPAVVLTSPPAETSASAVKTTTVKTTVTATQKVTTVRTTTEPAETYTEPETDEAVTEEPVTEFLYLDINLASRDELKLLNGIGDVLADAVIEYREKNGSFRNIEEIMLVNGIGEGIFYGICDHIYVQDPIYDIPEPETEPPTETEPPVTETTAETVTEASVTTTEEVTETVTFIEEETVPEEETEPVSEEPVTEYVSETETEEYKPTLEDLAPIDLNAADAETLMLLPHVDEEIAEEILELREISGGLAHIYELLTIEGLSRKDVSEIMEYAFVEPPEITDDTQPDDNE